MQTSTAENHNAIATHHPLQTMFRHNLWANQLLLTTCAKLGEEQLATSDPGAYGSIRATLEHLVRAEQGYLRRLAQPNIGERWPEEKQPTLGEMCELNHLTGQRLIEYAEDVQPDDIIQVRWDDKAWPIPAATILLQAINHATEHRTNVTTILQRLGIACPELDGWAYYMAMEAPTR